MVTAQVPAVTVVRIVERPAGAAIAPADAGGPVWRRPGPTAPGAPRGLRALAPGETRGTVTLPLWRTRDYAARGAARFNQLVDLHAEQVPADVLAAYRAAYDAAPEEAQVEFLIGVAGRLTLRLAEAGPDPIMRAAALLTEWFLKPR